MRFARLVLFVVAFPSAAILHAQLLDATLEVIPSRTLPGIPVSFRIRLTNPTSRAVCVPVVVGLRVMPDRAREFIARPYSQPYGDVFPVAQWAPLELIQPHKSVVIEMKSDGSFRTPIWLLDRRFDFIGEYDLEFVFFDYTDPPGIGGNLTPWMKPLAIARGRFVVEQPEGIDRIVWKFMFGTEGHQSYFPDLAVGVVDRYPESRYAGWLATTYPPINDEGGPVTLEKFLAQAPRDRYTEDRQKLLAGLDIFMADFYARLRPDLTCDYIDKGRPLLTSLARSESADTRAYAREKLEYLKERELNP